MADFFCDHCAEEYELKSQKARIGARVTDGAYIAMGVALPKPEVLARFRETLFLREAGAGARGWLIEVLKCAERAAAASGPADGPGGGFTLDDLYAFEPRLSALYPGNHNVRPKIRQQLQVLRNRGLLTFEGRGRYRLGRS